MIVLIPRDNDKIKILTVGLFGDEKIRTIADGVTLVFQFMGFILMKNYE